MSITTEHVGDEPYSTVVPPYADLPEQFTMSIAETVAASPVTATVEDTHRLALFALSAKAEVARLNGRIEADSTEQVRFRTEKQAEVDALTAQKDRLVRGLGSVNQDLARVKATVAEGIVSWAKENGQCREGTNEFLKGLGLPEMWETKWRVVAQYNGYTVLEVTDVEGDDEDDAVEAVKEDLDWDITVPRIRVSMDSGIGESAVYERHIDADESEGWDEDAFKEWFIGECSWSAEEAD